MSHRNRNQVARLPPETVVRRALHEQTKTNIKKGGGDDGGLFAVGRHYSNIPPPPPALKTLLHNVFNRNIPTNLPRLSDG